MNRLISILVLFVCVANWSHAQSRNVVFSLEPTSFISTVSRQSVESNVTKLLTTINQACNAQNELDLDSIKIEKDAKKNLEMLWKNKHFYCEQSSNVAPLLEDAQGYQVRGIEITLIPLTSFDGAIERELTISMNKAGTITGVRTALENDLVNDIVKKGLIVNDTRQRLEILKFIEDYRSYFNAKNLAALEKIYSDHGLIISGSKLICEDRNSMGKPFKKCEKYIVDYLKRMKTMFARQNYIDVAFDQVQVQRDGAAGKEHFYYVTLHQNMTVCGKNGNYSDSGWLFWLWDFKDPENPVIHIRTWQPEEAAQKDGVFGRLDFIF